MITFVGRKEPLAELQLLLKKKSASLVVIQGRRRIGKSRLIREFGKKNNLYIFSGIPPVEKTTAQSQREEFARQLDENFQLPGLKAEDWGSLFKMLSSQLSTKRAVVLFDEISWMGSRDPEFLGHLKNAWDLHWSQNPQLILILCGSVSTWIEENILSSTGFMGRISLRLRLKELSIAECYQFLDLIGFKYPVREKLKLLSVTGGVPRYLEEIQPQLSADDNIKRLCFNSSGVLFNEFEDIFSDLFSSRSPIYKKIVFLLSSGSCDFNTICEKIDMSKSGVLSGYLNDLILSGFITRDFTWHIKTSKESTLSHYRLSDNYVRFYLKYIEKNKTKIERGQFEGGSLSQMPGWDSVMGLQFENLVLNNRSFIWKKLNISADSIVTDNPFFQRKTAKSNGCQIDYLIQTKYNTLFFCEIKFSKNVIQKNIIDEMKEKMERFVYPKGFSCFPVLIHVNGVQDSVIDAEFFSECIDFSDILDL